jgi:hypothetical protein
MRLLQNFIKTGMLGGGRRSVTMVSVNLRGKEQEHFLGDNKHLSDMLQI